MSRRMTLSQFAEPIYLRPITDQDLPFLADLYAETRAEEMRILPWSDEQKQTFLRGQFDAQHKHYQDHFGSSDFDIIERGEDAIGRLYVDRREDEIRLIDIALLISARRQGPGWAR